MKNVFIALMTDHLGEPDVDDLARFEESYVRALAGFSTAEQQNIADRVLSTPRRRWPSVGECRNIGSDLRAVTQVPTYEPSDTERMIADHARTLGLLVSEIGVAAAQNGWIGPLWEFVSAHDRLPQTHELRALIVRAEQQRAALAADQSHVGRMVRAATEGRNQTRSDKVLALAAKRVSA